jgi:transposase-like protein
MAASKLDPKKLALVHIVKKELGLSDPVYRAILARVAGVRSAKDLDGAGFRRLMRFFVRSDYFRANADGMTLKQKLFIKSMANDLGWDPSHLRNFIRKYYQRDGIDALNRRTASKLIESLKAIREHGDGRAGDGEKRTRPNPSEREDP